MALTVHAQWMVLDTLLAFGTEEQKARWIPDLIRGRKIGAYTISEVVAGSDAAGIRARASRDGDGYVLNGTKYFSTNGGLADLHLLTVKTNPEAGSKGMSFFLVEKDAEGLMVGPPLDKTGCRSSDTVSLVMKNVRVPADHLLGAENGGFKAAMYGLAAGRLGVCSMGLGIAEAAFEEAVKYANERIAFGKPIASMYAIQEKIADMAVRLEAARLMVEDVARKMEAGDDISVASSMAKLLVADMANLVAHESVQIFGGHGYIKNRPVERYARDLRVMDIGVGTSEVMKMVVGGAVLRAGKSAK